MARNPGGFRPVNGYRERNQPLAALESRCSMVGNFERGRFASGTRTVVRKKRPRNTTASCIVSSGSRTRTARVLSASTTMARSLSGYFSEKRQAAHCSGHVGGVLSLSCIRDGRRLASGDDNGTVKVWDLDAGRETITLRVHTWLAQAVAWSLDGMLLASVGSDTLLCIWDATRGHALAPVADNPHHSTDSATKESSSEQGRLSP